MKIPAGRAFDRVLVIMFENQYRGYVMANPYFRALAAQGISMESYFGVMHPSQTNYIASVAGELCNVTDDDRPTPLLPQRTIVDLIEESPYGLSWRAYMESYIPQNARWSPGFAPQDEYPYVIKHNPFSSFANIVASEARWDRVTDESQLYKDLLNGTLPEYAWFTPNMWNDGHYTDGTQTDPPQRAPALVDQAAAWLESFFGALRFPGPKSHLPPRTMVVVTFDEADFRADWDAGKKYTYDGPNQIYTVLLGDHLEPGREFGSYNHYSLLRTIEENFSLGSLGKNDAGANWFRFLWGQAFRWHASEATPVVTTGPLAAAELEGLLLVAASDHAGRLVAHIRREQAWRDPMPIGFSDARELVMARSGDAIQLIATNADGLPSVLTFDLVNGWSAPAQPFVGEAMANLALAPFGAGELMLVYRNRSGAILSRRYQGGAWGAAVDTGHTTDGAIALGALGASLFLVFKTPQTDGLSVVTYNTADFNVVSLATSQFAGPYDNTTKDAWSPSAFPVGRFGAAPWYDSPGEVEPDEVPLQAGPSLAIAELDGVLHLVHPGVGSPILLEETFSVTGVLTPKLPVSYNASDETTTSNGYGTLAEAGWSAQAPVNGAALAAPGALAAARAGQEIVLLYHADSSGAVALCRGRYEPS